MKVNEVDKNFDTTFECPSDIKWHSVLNKPFSIHGVIYSKEEGLFRRLPKEFAAAINENVAFLAKNTAGGRIGFKTNSSYIALQVEEPFDEPFSHMTIFGKNGVSIFVNKEYIGCIAPSYSQLTKADPNLNGNGKIIFDGIVWPNKENEYEVELYLPLYSALNNIYVGLKDGSSLLEISPYKHEKPIVFYGSSITQGACASKPGDDYISKLSRMLDFDFINYGLSGNAKAEKEVAEYLSKIDASVFILDYDHNAPDVDYLRKTHYPLYKTIRDANPTTPIIMMTMPAFEAWKDRPVNKARREVILETIEKAKKDGDNNIYLIDCYGCFGDNNECGTIDNGHPNSLGFQKMAEKLYPLLNKLLN